MKKSVSSILKEVLEKVGLSKEESARREVYEETGLKDLKFVKEMGSYERSTRKSKDTIKHISVLLFKTDKSMLVSHDSENPSAKWVELGEVSKTLTYPEDRSFFLKIKDKI